MERSDIDKDFDFVPQSDKIKLKLKNEAIETHAIKELSLLAVKKINKTDRVFESPDGNFYSTSNITGLELKGHTDPYITSNYDKDEYFTESDTNSILTNDTLTFDFEKDKNAILISYRQSLMLTYFLYQSMGYMGTKYFDWLQIMDRRYDPDSDRNFINYLGQINVEYLENGKWNYLGNFFEAGPISTDNAILTLPEGVEAEKVRLVMTKKMWQIDMLASANAKAVYESEFIHPNKMISYEGRSHDPTILKNDEYLYTFPGDEYDLSFDLHSDYENYEYFMYTNGYYIEWQRESWLEDEDQEMVALMISDTEEFLNIHTSKYKEYESIMEEVFWSSKYVRP